MGEEVSDSNKITIEAALNTVSDKPKSLRLVEACWDDAMEKASELALALRYLPYLPDGLSGASDMISLLENQLEVEWEKLKKTL